MANLGNAGKGAMSGAAIGAAFGPWGAAIGGVAGGLIGLFSGDDNSDQITAEQKQALAAIDAVQDPGLKQATFERYVSAGVITPQMEQTISQAPSAMTGIKTDPALQQAQMGALAKLQSMGNGGLQAQDLAALSQAQRASDQDAQAKQAQIMQEMQQRGQGGSGSELISRLMGAQQGADRLSQQDMSIQAQASQRALQSIMNAGQLGGQIQAQSFNQQAQQAAAQDAINKFNAANAQQVAGQNTNRTNYGQQYNLQNLQNIMNSNTGLANQEQMYNNNIRQLNYNDQLGLAQAKSKALNVNAGQMQDQQYRSNQNFSNTMSGLGTSAVGIAGAMKGGGGAGNASIASNGDYTKDPNYLGHSDTNAGESGYGYTGGG